MVGLDWTGLDVPLIMESPRKERVIVDMKSTLAKKKQIVKHLLPAHAISGCDTVASYYGLGKGSVIKALKAGYDLSAIGNVDAPFQQVLDQATAFISGLLWHNGEHGHDTHEATCLGGK